MANPDYPASTIGQATSLVLDNGNTLHKIINGTSEENIEVEDGVIPTLRKSIKEAFYYKDPIDWVENDPVTVYNQLVKWTDGTLWLAPTATGSNPILMGTSPVGDDLWILSAFSAYSYAGESPDLPNGTPLQHNKPWLVDTSTPRSRPLPTNPSSGDIITVRDDTGKITNTDGTVVNKIVIEYTDVPIMGLTENLEITVNWSWVKLQYMGSRNDWRVIEGGVGGQVKVVSDEIANTLYPVGHVIFSMNTNNPASYLQFGVWQRVAVGKFIAGVGDGTDSNGVVKAFSSRDNVGEWEHTQTEVEVGSHTHKAGEKRWGNPDNDNAEIYWVDNGYGNLPADLPNVEENQEQGTVQAMNVTTPSFGMYVWERIA